MTLKHYLAKASMRLSEMMPFPSASRNSAFITGLTLSLPAYLLYIGLGSSGDEKPSVVAGIVTYGLLTLLIFVIDIRSLAPEALKTSIPWVYFPSNQAGWSYLFRLLGRVLIWLLGIATGTGLLAALGYFSRLF
jgi:hypothetical protein